MKRRRIGLFSPASPSTSPSTTLRRLSIFADCTIDDLAPVFPHVDLVSFPAGAVIDRVGTFPRQFIGIVHGIVDGVDVAGRPFLLGPGDHIGAAELFAKRPLRATYTTSTTTTFVAIYGPLFRSTARRLPGVVERSTVSRRPPAYPPAFLPADDAVA